MKHINTNTRQVSGLLHTAAEATFSGIEARILLGKDNASAFTVMQMAVSRDSGAPLHRSPQEDKVFNITSGRFLFLVGGKTFITNTGDCVYVPKGTQHSFRALDCPSSGMTLVSTPAHHDVFFLRLSTLSEPHNPEDVMQVCAECWQELMGPVVEPESLDLHPEAKDASHSNC